MHPNAPLLSIWKGLGLPEDAPVEIRRQDGTMHSDESIGLILRRITTLPGAGLGEDLLPLVAMHGATRLGDELLQSGLMSAKEPLLHSPDTSAMHVLTAIAGTFKVESQGTWQPYAGVNSMHHIMDRKPCTAG